MASSQVLPFLVGYSINCYNHNWKANENKYQMAIVPEPQIEIFSNVLYN